MGSKTRGFFTFLSISFGFFPFLSVSFLFFRFLSISLRPRVQAGQSPLPEAVGEGMEPRCKKYPAVEEVEQARTGVGYNKLQHHPRHEHHRRLGLVVWPAFCSRRLAARLAANPFLPATSSPPPGGYCRGAAERPRPHRRGACAGPTPRI